MATGSMNIPNVFVGRPILGNNPTTETVNITLGAKVGFKFQAPRSGRIRGVGIVLVFGDDATDIRLRISSFPPFITVPPTGSNVLIEKDFTVKDPLIHVDGDASPILRLDVGSYIQIHKGQLLLVEIEGLDSMTSVDVAYISDAGLAIPNVFIDEVGEASAMPVVCIDYDTGNLADYSLLQSPTGVHFAPPVKLADAEQGDIDGIATEYYPGTQATINGVWAKCYVPVGEQFELRTMTTKILDLYHLSGNFSLFSETNLPYVFADTPPFIIGMIGDDPEPDDDQGTVRLIEAGASVIEDLVINRFLNPVTDLAKHVLPFGTFLKALEHNTPGQWTGPFGAAYDAGFIVSEFRDALASELSPLIEAIIDSLPGDTSDLLSELGLRSGFNPMAITPFDLQLSNMIDGVDEVSRNQP
jgi:hypothetical protein